MDGNKIRLKWKIFAFLLGFCALLLVILWLFQTVLLDTFYKNIKVLEIKRDAGIIANHIDDDDIRQIISNISQNSGIVVDLTDMNGNSLLLASPTHDPRIANEISSLIAQAHHNGGEFFQYNKPQPMPGMYGDRRTVPESLVYVKLVEGTDSGHIVILIGAVITPVDATVATLRHQLHFLSIIMLIFSVVLAFFIARRISKPIEDISKSAEILAKGDYNTRFSGKGFQEIVALSDTLNTTAVELGRVEDLRRELIANVSHDLRTPLALIQSYAELMSDFPDEVTSEQTQVIIAETQRLSTLVNDLLNISQLESDIKNLNISDFNLTGSISETVERMEALLKNEGFNIYFNHDSDVFVNADKMKIDRVFYNLLINAVNYSDESRKITVEQTITENSVRISVTDGGGGIDEADLPLIWDRYYKCDKKHKRAITGSGLGLSIVKKIMELHNGSFGATSEVGKGSTFWFEINK